MFTIVALSRLKELVSCLTCQAIADNPAQSLTAIVSNASKNRVIAVTYDDDHFYVLFI